MQSKKNDTATIRTTTMQVTTTFLWIAIVGAIILAFAFHAIYKFNRATGNNHVFGMDHDEIYYHDNDIEDDED